MCVCITIGVYLCIYRVYAFYIACDILHYLHTLYTIFYTILYIIIYYTTGKGVQEFPFRKETFITSPSKIKALLHWKPKRSLQTDLAADIAEVYSILILLIIYY